MKSFIYLFLSILLTSYLLGKDTIVYFHNPEVLTNLQKSKLNDTIQKKLILAGYDVKSDDKIKRGTKEIYNKYLVKKDTPKFIKYLGDELNLDKIISVKAENNSKLFITLELFNVKNNNIKSKLLIFDKDINFIELDKSLDDLLDESWKERISLSIISKRKNHFHKLIKNKTEEVLTLSGYQVDTKDIFKTAYKIEITITPLDDIFDVTYKLFNNREQQLKVIINRYNYDQNDISRVFDFTSNSISKILNINTALLDKKNQKKIFIKGNLLQFKFSDSIKSGIEKHLVVNDFQIVKREKDSDKILIITTSADKKPYPFKMELFDRENNAIEKSYTLFYNNELNDKISLEDFGEKLILTLLGEIEAPTQHYFSFLNITPLFDANYLLFDDMKESTLFFLGVEINLLHWEYRSFFIDTLGGGVAIGNASYLSYWGNLVTIGINLNNFIVSARAEYREIRNDQDDIIKIFATAKIGYFWTLFEKSGLLFSLLTSYGKSNHGNINKQSGILLSGGVSFNYHF